MLFEKIYSVNTRNNRLGMGFKALNLHSFQCIV